MKSRLTSQSRLSASDNLNIHNQAGPACPDLPLLFFYEAIQTYDINSCSIYAFQLQAGPF